MVAVPVDGPLREEHVGLLFREQVREAIVVLRIDNRSAVDLIGEGSASFRCGRRSELRRCGWRHSDRDSLPRSTLRHD